jgi:hypothetical protein
LAALGRLERFRLYEVDGAPKLTERKLRNYMARAAGDRRRL